MLQAFQFGSTNQRLMDYDSQYGYLKIFGNVGAVDHTEFTGAVMTWSKSYTYLSGRLLATVTPNGTTNEITEFNHPDRLGTKLISNQSTGTISEQATLPFGRALDSESSIITNSKRFTSYERSKATGLDYAVNRTYDSKLGRFTQVDPIGMKAATLEVPQTLNLYNYCGNDPINNTDADGLFWGAIGRFFKKVGKILSAVAEVLGRVLNNRWVRIGFFILDFVLPGIKLLSGIVGRIADFAIKLYNKVSEIVGEIQIASALFQGKFKEIGISLAIAYAMAPLTALASSIKTSIQKAIFEHKGGFPDLASFFYAVGKGFVKGFREGAKYLKEIYGRAFFKQLIPAYGIFCGIDYGDNRIGAPGINEFDTSVCGGHDGAMLRNKRGQLGLFDRILGDLTLVGRSFIYGTSVHAIDIAFAGRPGLGANYKFLLQGGFILGRILPGLARIGIDP